MKKSFLCFIAFILCMMSFVACGSEKNQNNNRTGRDFFIIETTERQLATPEIDSDWRCLGMQFLEGEVLQLWGKSVRNEQLQGFWDVYLYHEDGSSEFLFGGVPTKYRDNWYMDDEDGCYILLEDTLIKLNKDGEELYRRIYEDRTFVNLYQDKKGRWMVLGEAESGTLIASELNRETGDITDKGSLLLESGIHYVSGQADGVYLMDLQGVWKLNLEEGIKEAVLSFVETGYNLKSYPTNFEVTADNRVNMLQGGKVISLERVNLADSREIVTIGSVQELDEVDDCIEKFNAESDTYYVVWEKIQEDESVAAYKEKIGIEIAAGGGPDLMFVGGAVNPNNIYDFMEKGVFERLNPYMEQAGLNEGDYFPVAFNGLRDGEDIYGISVLTQLSGQWISAEVLGSNENPTLEELMDILLAYEKPAVFMKKSSSSSLLNYFLKSSDTVCGTVNWETGTCDFEGELFAKILQVAKRYGDDRTMDLPALAGTLGSEGLYHYTMYEQRMGQGQVPIWNYFDDGCYPGCYIMYTMAINSNAICKDGAWAFIEFLLNGDLQSTLDSGKFPVKRSGFDELVQKEMEEGALLYEVDGGGRYHITTKAGLGEYDSPLAAVLDYDNYRAKYDLTDEKVEEIRQMLEVSRTFPTHTQSILNIISEETGAYFAGDKTLEEVCKTIENRVQLYLDEHN